MALEFDIRKTKRIDIEILRKEVVDFYEKYFHINLKNRLFIRKNSDTVRIDFFLEINPIASVWVFDYDAGCHEEGGWWLTLSIGHLRTKASFLLLFVTSIILSKKMKTTVIDDCSITESGRVVTCKFLTEKTFEFYEKNKAEINL